jgi:hypothetical protein
MTKISQDPADVLMLLSRAFVVHASPCVMSSQARMSGGRTNGVTSLEARNIAACICEAKGVLEAADRLRKSAMSAHAPGATLTPEECAILRHAIQALDPKEDLVGCLTKYVPQHRFDILNGQLSTIAAKLGAVPPPESGPTTRRLKVDWSAEAMSEALASQPKFDVVDMGPLESLGYRSVTNPQTGEVVHVPIVANASTKVRPENESFAGCHAGRDGECNWDRCPQNRDNEPAKSGRHCPLDQGDDEEELNCIHCQAQGVGRVCYQCGMGSQQ